MGRYSETRDPITELGSYFLKSVIAVPRNRMLRTTIFSVWKPLGGTLAEPHLLDVVGHLTYATGHPC